MRSQLGQPQLGQSQSTLTRSYRRLVSRAVTSALVALGLWGLVLPPTISAGVLEGAPESFGVTFLFANLSLEFAQEADGDYAWGDSLGRQGVVSAELMSHVEVLSATQGSDGQFELRLNVPDGLGGSALYSMSGTRLASGGVQGVLVDSAGAAQSVLLDWTGDGGGGGGGDTVAPWLLVAGAVAAVGLVGCAVVSIATDCIGDCSAGCGSGGMASASEGFCGTCECECN